MQNTIEMCPEAKALLERKPFYRINEVTELLSCSRSRVFILLREHELTGVKHGRDRLVTASSLAGYVHRRVDVTDAVVR